MALSFGQTGTADSIDADYFTQRQADSPVGIHMHLDAVEGIAREAADGGAGVSGLLLGRVEPGDRPTVRIDRYHRVFDDPEHKAFEDAAGSISRDGELSIVGFYRSHNRPGFELEPIDLELINRYFRDSSDVILIVDPSSHEGCFFAGGFTGDPFPLRGRAVADDSAQPDTTRTAPPEKARRIVPDFTQAPVEPKLPAKEMFAQAETSAEHHSRLRKWLPVTLALLLVGCAVWFFLLSSSERPAASPPQPAAATAPIRPLGLYVDSSGDSWRVSWNPSATALAQARGVALFVRDGDDQNRIDLSPNDLASGTYQYRPKGPDVTFRLEVTEATGHISAESFRFMRSVPAAAPVTAAAAKPAPVPAHTPKAVHRVAPVVPASIRPRIHGAVPVDVRVVVDAKGRVTSAATVTKHNGGLTGYLSERAVAAARQWRFETDSPGSETIHFVFEK